MRQAAVVLAAVSARSRSNAGRWNGWLLGLSVTMGGCGYDTAIYGMYFPSWVVAPVFGAAAAALSLWWVARTRWARYVAPGVVVFSALTLIYAVLFWGLFFDA